MKLNKRLQSSCVSFAEMAINTEYYIHKQESYEKSDSNKEKPRTKNVLLIPPDPHWNGDMYMPFINDLFTAIDKEQMSVMRFSFNKSPIVNENYTKYVIQASLCLEYFIHETSFLSDFFVVGYSFGSLIALLLALRRPEIVTFIMVSPPILHYDFFASISTLRMNGLCLYGAKDEIVPESAIEQFTSYLKTKMIYLDSMQIQGANHYLSGKTDETCQIIINYIKNYKHSDVEADNPYDR
jgi:alpha/beta superfamily hydrolase